MLLPYFGPPSSLESLTKPISQEEVTITSDEYVEREDFELYFPIKFKIVSILVNQIEKYHDFDKEQWEYSGYKMPDESTFMNVKGFLCSLPENYLFNLNPENIEPTPYGTFVLEFTNVDKVLSIEVGKNKIGYYTKNIDLSNTQSEGIDFNADNLPQEILDAFEKMRA